MDNNNTQIFSVNGIKYELFFASEDFVEIYEIDRPAQTGFVFDTKKDFILFINLITDMLEKKINMEEK